MQFIINHSSMEPIYEQIIGGTVMIRLEQVEK